MKVEMFDAPRIVEKDAASLAKGNLASVEREPGQYWLERTAIPLDPQDCSRTERSDDPWIEGHHGWPRIGK